MKISAIVLIEAPSSPKLRGKHVPARTLVVGVAVRQEHDRATVLHEGTQRFRCLRARFRGAFLGHVILAELGEDYSTHATACQRRLKRRQLDLFCAPTPGANGPQQRRHGVRAPKADVCDDQGSALGGEALQVGGLDEQAVAVIKPHPPPVLAAVKGEHCATLAIVCGLGLQSFHEDTRALAEAVCARRGVGCGRGTGAGRQELGASTVREDQLCRLNLEVDVAKECDGALANLVHGHAHLRVSVRVSDAPTRLLGGGEEALVGRDPRDRARLGAKWIELGSGEGRVQGGTPGRKPVCAVVAGWPPWRAKQPRERRLQEETLAGEEGHAAPTLHKGAQRRAEVALKGLELV